MGVMPLPVLDRVASDMADWRRARAVCVHHGGNAVLRAMVVGSSDDWPRPREPWGTARDPIQPGSLHAEVCTALGGTVNGVTVARYLDLLVDLLLVRRTPAVDVQPRAVPRQGAEGLHPGQRRLPRAAGHRVGRASSSRTSPASCRGRASCGYYRTAGGAEIDFVVDLGAGETWAICPGRNLERRNCFGRPLVARSSSFTMSFSTSRCCMPGQW